jgi:transcriptional regulator with XRE-family HTH domain
MSTVSSETFGQRVRRIREKQGLRQVDLAPRAGISWRHLIRIEQDRGGVTKPGTIARLAEALGVEVAELTGGDEDDEEADQMTLDEFLQRRIDHFIRKTTEPTASLAKATAGSDSQGGY